MFGHLKAADFMSLIEGTPLAERRRAHLGSCARCADTLKSVEIVRNQVSEIQMTADEHVPEPDWTDFRGDVRNALLSRSVQRQNKNRSWFGGMSWNPAAAWGFSMLLVFGLTTGVVMWNQNGIEQTVAEAAQAQEAQDSAATINAIASMGQTDVFDDVLRLNENETESLRLLLEDLTRKSGSPQ